MIVVFIQFKQLYFCCASFQWHKSKNEATVGNYLRGPTRGSGEQGNNAIYFSGTGEHKSKHEGNKCSFGE